MAEVLLDSAIRMWVFLPLVIITFLFGVIRHYVTILISSDKKAEPEHVSDQQVLMRSRLLRENANYIPRHAFASRKHYFNDKETGFFKTAKRESAMMKNPMTDPSMMTEMVKGNFLNMIPMLVIGGWINWAFSGFLTTKVPFPLTYRFKPMLQRGCESLVSLDASWVSSASWYFLNIFGLRSVYTLVLGADNSADQARLMQDNMMLNPGAAGGQGFDAAKAFKAEWETLELVEHNWALENVAEALLGPGGGPTSPLDDDCAIEDPSVHAGMVGGRGGIRAGGAAASSPVSPSGGGVRRRNK